MKTSDIKKIHMPRYKVDVSWGDLKRWLQSRGNDMGIDLDPPFQRGYVWTEEQKTAYIEFIMRGGMSGRAIYFNYPNWGSGSRIQGEKIVVVDGKQRLTAVLDFLDNKIKAFGCYLDEFEDNNHLLNSDDYGFNFYIADIVSKKEVIEWYIAMNTGGSIHTQEDLKAAYDALSSY